MYTCYVYVHAAAYSIGKICTLLSLKSTHDKIQRQNLDKTIHIHKMYVLKTWYTVL